MIILSGNARSPVLALLLLIHYLPLSAQQQPAMWLFGDHNGIDFRSGSAIPITNPNVSYHGAEVRGVSTVTDNNGNLLFYSENETVYNRQHDTMMNGSKMNGVWAATQSGLTVRAIHDTTLYYLFTTNLYEINGQSYSKPDLWYSVIDMKGDDGRGAVTTKNVMLFDKPTTQLCAIRHCNERDIWIVTHERETDAYYAFLVTREGVSSSPVVSHSGRVVVPSAANGFSNQYGYMKASPDGKKIAASWMAMGADLADFDNATGIVSGAIDLNLMNGFFAQAQGVEFSPDSKVLYATYNVNSINLLYQYNVSAGSGAAIVASKTKLEETYFFGMFAGMQRGPDDKIYVATYGQPYVSVIHNPNIVGTGCNYVLQGLALNGRSSHNFPAYMETKYFAEEPAFTFSSTCPAESVSFDYDKPGNVLSVQWDFDDPSSGSANSSTALNPVHEFSGSGIYHVKLIRFLVCSTDTLEQEISVTKVTVDVGKDTALCGSNGYLLQPVTAPALGLSYLWNTGSVEKDITVTSSGLYWLEVTSGQCSYRDSVQVTLNSLSVNLGRDTTICENETLVLDAGNQALDYTWQDGSKNSSITVGSAGIFTVTVRSGACTATDAVEVLFRDKPVLDLGADKEICGSEVVMLGSNLPVNYSYAWENGSSSPVRTVDSAGTFRLTASNECGSASDEVVVTKGGCVLGVPNAFSPNADGRNDVFSISRTTALLSFTMQVYNRWGQKIFESRDQSKGWDGKFAGKICDVGHYAYVIQYVGENATPVTLKGMVLLVK